MERPVPYFALFFSCTKVRLLSLALGGKSFDLSFLVWVPQSSTLGPTLFLLYSYYLASWWCSCFLLLWSFLISFLYAYHYCLLLFYVTLCLAGAIQPRMKRIQSAINQKNPYCHFFKKKTIFSDRPYLPAWCYKLIHTTNLLANLIHIRYSSIKICLFFVLSSCIMLKDSRQSWQKQSPRSVL